MGHRLATIDTGRKVGAGLLCPFPWGESLVPSNTVAWAEAYTSVQVASWSIQPFGHNTPTLQTDRTTVR